MVASSVTDETWGLRPDACAEPCAENATGWPDGRRSETTSRPVSASTPTWALRSRGFPAVWRLRACRFAGLPSRRRRCSCADGSCPAPSCRLTAPRRREAFHSYRQTAQGARDGPSMPRRRIDSAAMAWRKRMSRSPSSLPVDLATRGHSSSSSKQWVRAAAYPRKQGRARGPESRASTRRCRVHIAPSPCPRALSVGAPPFARAC